MGGEWKGEARSEGENWGMGRRQEAKSAKRKMERDRKRGRDFSTASSIYEISAALMGWGDDRDAAAPGPAILEPADGGKGKFFDVYN